MSWEATGAWAYLLMNIMAQCFKMLERISTLHAYNSSCGEEDRCTEEGMEAGHTHIPTDRD
jgi:hypothetical protein